MFFLKYEEEATINLFHICRKTQALYNLPHLTPQSAIFIFLDISKKDYLILNYLLLLFNCYFYNARDQEHLIFETLMKDAKEHL